MNQNQRTDSPALLCVPHAGGAARVFAPLSAALPDIPVEPLELPGHGRRMAEAARSGLTEVLDDLVEQTEDRVSDDYVLLGHSMGAALAFELARYWSRRQRPPLGLLLIGRNGPGIPSPHGPIHGLETARFLAALRRLGGTPPQLFDNPELVELFTPLLRADFTLSETYRPLPDPTVLDCPVHICAGVDDPMTTPAGLQDWRRHTTGVSSVQELPGAHFILDSPHFHRYVSDTLSGLPRLPVPFPAF